MILENYTEFIDKVFERIARLGIVTDQLTIDHIGYQADSASDYLTQIAATADKARVVSENIVGGRRVCILQLNKPLEYKAKSFSVIEIFEPKADQKVNSGWEHVELLVPNTLNDFMAQYPDIDFDTSVMNRDQFPMLILPLGDGLRAKFPKKGVLEEIRRQITE